MVNAPVRIQLRRTKGWRMPPNTVKVDRTNKTFGNPFSAKEAIEAGYLKPDSEPNAFLADCFREWLGDPYSWWSGPEANKRRQDILDGAESLRGKNLACWCALDKPCHADVLLGIANAHPSSMSQEGE